MDSSEKIDVGSMSEIGILKKKELDEGFLRLERVFDEPSMCIEGRTNLRLIFSKRDPEKEKNRSDSVYGSIHADTISEDRLQKLYCEIETKQDFLNLVYQFRSQLEEAIK